MSQISPITTVDEELSAQFTKDQLVEMLSTENIYEVVFEKKDGTLRTMYCSRNSSFIPAKPETITESAESATSDPKPVRKENPNVVPVYDIQKSAWRNFTVSSVKSIRTVESVPANDDE